MSFVEHWTPCYLIIQLLSPYHRHIRDAYDKQHYKSVGSFIAVGFKVKSLNQIVIDRVVINSFIFIFIRMKFIPSINIDVRGFL